MALGKKKKKEASKSDNNLWRQIGAIWENTKGKDSFFSISFSNLKQGVEEVEEYVKGRLIWQDLEEDKYYLVKGCNVLEPKTKREGGPEFNLSINLDNEYHVELFDES